MDNSIEQSISDLENKLKERLSQVYEVETECGRLQKDILIKRDEMLKLEILKKDKQQTIRHGKHLIKILEIDLSLKKKEFWRTK